VNSEANKHPHMKPVSDGHLSSATITISTHINQVRNNCQPNSKVLCVTKNRHQTVDFNSVSRLVVIQIVQTL